MERRKAITTAAAASLTLLAGAAGIALNSGIVGAGQPDDVGQLTPITASDEGSVASLDRSSTVAPPAVQRSDSAPATESSASGYTGDDEYEDDDEDERSEYRDHDDHDEEEGEGHEYEGGDDDD